jgi:hypothetical protein
MRREPVEPVELLVLLPADEHRSAPKNVTWEAFD